MKSMATLDTSVVLVVDLVVNMVVNMVVKGADYGE